MRPPLTGSCVLLGLALAAAPCAAANPERALEHALARLSADSLRAHVAALADDRMEGRATGTRGYDLAAAYVAGRMKAIGLTPGAAGGSFLQQVPFARGQVRESACSLVVGYDDVAPRGGLDVERPLAYGTDYLMAADLLRDETALNGPMMFAGYGVVAPELGYDDYEGLDVKGKVVVVLTGAPPSFPSDQRAYHSWNALKEREAAARGARGLLSVRTPVDERRTPWERAVRQSRLPAMRWTDERGAPHDVQAGLEVVGTMNRSGAEALFYPMPLDSVLDGSAFHTMRAAPFHLLHAGRATQRSRARSANVIGVLRGSDPRRRDEFVVYTAHLDHLGISTPVNGDSINNGAYDNASGVALMLEIARAFTALKPRPRRSLAFVAVTGEEKGLQGSDYFARFPSMPRGQVVADVNLDMFLMLRPLRDVIAFGAGHSSLGAAVDSAARRRGLAVSPDPMPEEVVFIRSDQFSFVRQGIPAVFLVGGRAGDGSIDEERQRWSREVYHTPQDDLTQRFRWDEGVTFADFGLRVGLEIANAPGRPTWNPGDYFGETFGRAASGPARSGTR